MAAGVVPQRVRPVGGVAARSATAVAPGSVGVREVEGGGRKARSPGHGSLPAG
jgi:hypothetical protein